LKGVYALEIQLSRDIRIVVGALGTVDFKKGKYYYVGSAQRNLESRVKRHLRREKKIFWHIDFLLDSEYAKVKKVLFSEGGKELECQIAQNLSSKGTPIAKFGCSDCNCQSHLFTKVSSLKVIEDHMIILDPNQN
jgi:Uri superfamily endonuclease